VQAALAARTRSQCAVVTRTSSLPTPRRPGAFPPGDAVQQRRLAPLLSLQQSGAQHESTR